MRVKRDWTKTDKTETDKTGTDKTRTDKIRIAWTRSIPVCVLPVCVLSVCLLSACAVLAVVAYSPSGPSDSTALAADQADAATAGWDRRAAARYLDDRETYWQGWERAKKDHGTLCVSCHTQASYGLARPAMRHDLGEQGPSEPEKVMLASIEKRVALWDGMAPFYDDATSGAGKEVESRNAESVLNSVILSSYDRQTGHLSPAARTAFAHAWALQSTSGLTKGAWVWQNFHYTPWESPESEYHGAALMAVAVARAPDDYRDEPQIAPHLAASPVISAAILMRNRC